MLPAESVRRPRNRWIKRRWSFGRVINALVRKCSVPFSTVFDMTMLIWLTHVYFDLEYIYLPTLFLPLA
jgi:hypothetical protein